MESPVQLLNVLEWSYGDALRAGPAPAPDAGALRAGPASALDGGAPESGVPDAVRLPEPDVPHAVRAPGPGAPDAAPPPVPALYDGVPRQPYETVGDDDEPGPAPRCAPTGLTVVVLAPHDPMTRGQLRRMAELARGEGHTVRWEEARGGAGAPAQTIAGLAPLLRRASRIVIGDPFSRYVQLLLTIARARDVVVVDDGTATMEFVSQLALGTRLVRWHRRGGRGARDLVFAPFAASARRRLTPGEGRRVEVFTSMPVQAPPGVTVTANDFAWTRSAFGPPRLTRGTDLVGTSLVETGVVDLDHYLTAVASLARTHGATRYFAHRRESTDKLHRIGAELGLEIVRPDLPLELIARRGPIGRMILSFPSTVVHTLPLALAGTGITVAVCDVDPAWLTETASPRAEDFLSGVTGTARGIRRVPYVPASTL